MIALTSPSAVTPGIAKSARQMTFVDSFMVESFILNMLRVLFSIKQSS
jgi:hypothetical protein